jgi:hypothetical protein
MMFETYENPDASLLIRTDFADDAAWTALCDRVQQPEPNEGFCAIFVFIDDPQIGAMSVEAIAAQVHADTGAGAVFIADATAMAAPDYAVLCIDTGSAPLASFRVIPREIWGPENNLKLGNMDFADFAGAAGADGVFRGF